MVPEQFDNDQFRYRTLPQDEQRKLLDEFIESFSLFRQETSNFFSEYSSDIRINRSMMFRIFERIDQRRDYYRYFHSDENHRMEMSQTKEVSLFCYWLLRYKPLSFEDAQADQRFFVKNSFTLNEFYAAYVLISFITEQDPENVRFFSVKTFTDLTYSLMNREISKEALILYVETFRVS